MNKLSVVMIVKGEPPFLFKSIDSVTDLADEIVIVDIGLSSKVKDTLKKNAKVIIEKVDEEITYVEQIREQSKKYAKHDHVLFLDPDEIISEALAQIIEKEYMNYDYITIPRKNIIFGKWIEHSRWWPDYQTRVFNKHKVTWPDKLHAQPDLQGEGLVLEPKEEHAMIHHNYLSVDEYVSKMVRYAKADAESRERYPLANAINDGLQEFISRFFADQGYKDGTHGFVLAFLQMMYYFLVYCYSWEKNKYYEEDMDSLSKKAQSFFSKGLYQINHWIIRENLEDSYSRIKNKLISKLLK